MFQWFYQPIVEGLYSFKKSDLFQLYTLFVGFLFMLLILMFFRRRRINRILEEQVNNPRQTNYNKKLSLFQHNKEKQEMTKSEVKKLIESAQYQQYLIDNQNPRSHVNLKRQNIEVSDIEFSDESEQQTAQNTKKNKKKGKKKSA